MNNETQSKSNMKVPRYIFAIGGAGKNLAYTTLEKEWILREILKPKFAATTIDVIIIDTALDEENVDRDKIAEIETKIKTLEEEYRNNPAYTNKNIGRINITYMLLTKEMVLQSPYDLIGIGDNVKKATGASIWWINDPQLGEDWHKKVINRENFSELNFSKGVYRKRAIGKAIFYKALAEGFFDIDLIQTAQVDIIVGMGGGSGSGMAFDLARRLKTIQPTADLTLFGVLSTLDESSDEKINSFAMISELEYGRLNRDNTFKDIVLIPMEVTRYPGKERASDEHERLLKEFDETVPYILIAYHNNPAQLLFSGLPEYATFIIATSQLIRYNVDSIKKLKEILIQALLDKETSLEDEGDIYNTIQKFTDRFYGENVNKGSLSEDDKSFIKEERFSKFKTVLEHEFFKELNYNSVIHLKKAMDAGITGSGSEDIEKQISSIRSEIDTISIGNEGFREDADSTLFKILKKDIETIEVLKNTLNLINSIQDNLVRDTLKTIIKIDEYSLGRKLNQIREQIDNLIGKKKYIEGIIKSLEEEITNYEEKIKKEIEENNREWKQNEIKNIDILDLIDELTPVLNHDFTNLKNELGEYIVKLNSINNTKIVDAEPARTIESTIDKTYSELERIGIYYGDKTLILRSLSNIRDFRKAQIDYGRRIPLLDRALGAIIKTDRIKKQKDAKTKILQKTAELNNDKIFDIRNGSIFCAYEYDLGQNISETKDEIINALIDRIKDKYPNASPVLISDLKAILETKRKEANIGDIIKSNLGYEVDIDKKENELKEKRAEIAKVSDNINMLKTLETLLKNITPALKRHSERLKNYHNQIMNIGKDMQAMYRAKKDVIRYIMEMQPANIFKATISGANINNILEDKSEGLALKQNLQDGIECTIDNRYNTLVRRVIETDDHTKRWQKSKVMNAFVTTANISPDQIDSKKTIIDAFSVVKDNYSEWKCPWGDSWGVGLVLFVSGVPMDNIRNVIDSRTGYYNHYMNIQPNGKVFLHHSHMLEKGKFARRKQIFNIEKEDDRKLFLEDSKDINSKFSQNYEEVEISKCL